MMRFALGDRLGLVGQEGARDLLAGVGGRPVRSKRDATEELGVVAKRPGGEDLEAFRSFRSTNRVDLVVLADRGIQAKPGRSPMTVRLSTPKAPS